MRVHADSPGSAAGYAAEPTEMARLQEAIHGADFDYDAGSPHLSHPQLRAAILGEIRALVADQFKASGRCRVLEVGAGHGAFTDHVLAMGADVTVTEMSRPSLDMLQSRYAHNSQAVLLFDPDGEQAFAREDRFDLVLCVSVLHHIPDYETFVDRVTGLIEDGGAFASFQDPSWYPRRTPLSVRLDRLMYLAWRISKGQNIGRGIATQLRRFRGVLDESNPSDMVEYHLMRNGVDEQALVGVLEPRFDNVRLWEYFSTQGRWMQQLGARVRSPQTFGLIATGRRCGGADGP